VEWLDDSQNMDLHVGSEWPHNKAPPSSSLAVEVLVIILMVVLRGWCPTYTNI
jgi:hypothetical protein